MHVDVQPEAINAKHIAVQSIGQGEPLLLVAGLGGRAAFWSHQVAALAGSFQIVLHDHRGTGKSGGYSGPFSIAQMAGDVLDVMDFFGLKKAHFVGHSTGGAIGQFMAVHHPDRIDRLVISASWARPSAYFSALFKQRLAIMDALGDASYTLDGTLRGFPAHITAQRDDLLAGDGPAQVPDRAIQRGRIKAILDHDLAAQLPSIPHQTLVICAEDDAITPRPYSDEIAGAVPNAVKHILPTGGHFAPQAVPEDYTAAIGRFLQGEAI